MMTTVQVNIKLDKELAEEVEELVRRVLEAVRYSSGGSP